jgi:hypothetical protein
MSWGPKLAIAANAATALALIVGAWQFVRESDAGREQRRFGVYNELNSQYVDYLKMCVEYPWVDGFETRLQEPRAPRNPKEQRIEEAVYLTLVSLLERAYVFYVKVLPKDDAWAKTQWDGWALYADRFAQRERFRENWPLIRMEFDTDFTKWMDERVAAVSSR